MVSTWMLLLNPWQVVTLDIYFILKFIDIEPGVRNYLSILFINMVQFFQHF